ncbi:DnaB-like helicase N-terminal domain-containing protein [uncultured Sphaerochaeta sp.]|uniref:DnaB-like helicase N-terminal domain-containing protein n=1 Tax=uncultured Sphaerochaeta sp. TaxID=886478 RepID=UPI00261D28CB|nr:DnaB-like helicase N-terminal domain-containing protein [uncultured Sphaerochaeta sp.]
MSNQSERVVVGTCLLYPKKIPDIRAVVHQDMIMDPKIRAVYDHINRVYDGPEQFSINLVSASMSVRGELEVVGGETFVIDLTNDADVLQVDQAARIVVSNWSNVETDKIIRRFNQKRAETGTWEGLRDKMMTEMQNVRTRSRAWDAKLDIINQMTFSIDSPPPPPSVIVRVNGEKVASSGNIVLITGEEKSGKSGVVGALISGSMGASAGSSLYMDILRNDDGYGLIHVDTEQSQYDHYQDCMSILKRAGITHEPPWYRSIGMKGVNPETKLEYLEIAVADSYAKHGGIYSIFIDGVADMVKSVNDEEESGAITDKLEFLATKYNTTVFVILHYNPNSVKTRGTLGSNMRRKVETSIEVTKDWDSGVSTVKFAYTRNADRIRPIEFAFNKELGYHAPIGYPSQSAIPPLGSSI